MRPSVVSPEPSRSQADSSRAGSQVGATPASGVVMGGDGEKLVPIPLEHLIRL